MKKILLIILWIGFSLSFAGAKQNLKVLKIKLVANICLTTMEDEQGNQVKYFFDLYSTKGKYIYPVLLDYKENDKTILYINSGSEIKNEWPYSGSYPISTFEF